ncbi:MAG: FAD binding domain-containing protein [Chloroflexi bacterium]|nr:FAD binding domain-containing protein [Chloroflexota bacterium]
MWREYINAASIDDVLDALAKYGDSACVVAGATDLILEMERGIRKNIDVLIDITRVADLDTIMLDANNVLHLGPLVTHNNCVDSKLIREYAFPLAQACWGVGAPQIRNRGTVAGNLITASPANDTITPLRALDARVTLRSRDSERIVPLSEFYLGVRKTVMRPDEILVDIAFPALMKNQSATFLKLGLRQAQAISVVNVAILLTFAGNSVSDANITLGAVSPTIINASDAENYLVGQELIDDVIHETARLTQEASCPIDDIRASAAYRREMVRVLTARGLHAIKNHQVKSEFPENPILLRNQEIKGKIEKSAVNKQQVGLTTINTTINGKIFNFNTGHDKTLLDLLRDEAGLIGTKEGCGEGECGACTVHLDGEAVMSCLVPAPRAHGAEITTVEGLADSEKLHPVQEAFIDQGAVQCGYCTPGFIMSAAILLEEKPQPSREDIRHAITGNLCRCTGYYKIIDAIEIASKSEVADGQV